MRVFTLLNNLKQRKMAQWALAYLAGAWLLVQLIDVLGGRWGFTDTMGRVFDLAIVVGFFILLVVAWYHGERGHQRVTGTELLLIAGVLGLGGLFFTFVDLEDVPDRDNSRSTWVDLEDDRPSIAVLPFANRTAGGGEDADFFAVGIHEDILNTISRIESIRVLSRTSVMSFDDDARDIRDIAKALRVRTVLEGGVQVSGNQVRITLQLIDAPRAATLWSQSYQKALTTENIFTIQGDVARKVAAALEATLTAGVE